MMTMKKLIILMFLGLSSLSGKMLVAQAAIPSSDIDKLSKEIESVDPKQSSTRLRREYKNLIRDAEKLVDRYPDAENRFGVLHIMLKSQVKLLALDKSDRTRKELFETCEKLKHAPDEYAEFRLDADMFLSDRFLTEKQATIDDRINELKRITDQYKGTSAELKSLMSAVKMSDQLQDFNAKSNFTNRIKVRFADDPTAIAFVRKGIGFTRMDAIFSGQFEKLNGEKLQFPIDRMGHAGVAIFWSKEHEEHREFLDLVNVEQNQAPDRYEIYSFNLDELEDGGASILDDVGLKCAVLKLPEGIEHPAFLVYASAHPHGFVINEYGRVIFESKKLRDQTQAHAGKKKEKVLFRYPEKVPSDDRVGMQLQSLLNGDFLLHHEFKVPSMGTTSVGKMMGELFENFSEGPLRLRLSPSESFDMYSSILSKTTAFIEKHPGDAELWKIKSFRVVAELGLWNSTGDASYLEKAKADSEAILKNSGSSSEGIVARYCLARSSLRSGELDVEDVILQFVESSGEKSSSPLVLATATVLALGVNNSDLYESFRDQFLATSSESPYSVLAFLRSHYHRRYVFKGDIRVMSPGRPERNAERYYVVNNGVEPIKENFPKTLYKNIDGSDRSFPGEPDGNMDLVFFMEPPSNGNILLRPGVYRAPSKEDLAEIQRQIKEIEEANKGKSGRKKKRLPKVPQRSGALHTFFELAEKHISQGVDVTIVFLGGEEKQLQLIQERYEFPCEVLHLPAGLEHPIVRQLDLFSADRFPNMFLLRRDGTIAWSARAYSFRVEPNHYVRHRQLGLRNHLFRCEAEAGYQALKAKNFEQAEKFFSGPYEVKINLGLLDNWRQSGGRTEWHKWTATQHCGRALALVGQGEWEEALTAIEEAQLHHMVYFRHDQQKPCLAETGMHKIHGRILEELGRTTEAKAARSKASLPPTAYPTEVEDFRGWNRPYEVFDEKLMKLETWVAEKK